MRRLAIISSQAFSIPNFRGPLIQALIAKGVHVHALASDYDAGTRAAVAALGAEPIDYSLQRAGVSALRDALDLISLSRLLRRLAPDATFGYFIKPVIYGSLAAKLAGVPRRFSLIEGLGYVFAREEQGNGVRRRLLRATVRRAYRAALATNEKVFFLNPDDLAEFKDDGIIDAGKAVLLDGIGVDLAHYAEAPPQRSPVTFLLAARLLAEKGVREFADAAREVRARHPDVRIILAGGVDENPGSLERREVEQWVKDDVLEWTGHVADIRPAMREASVFVLPSYYREGLPRTIQEAMAMGRPIITSKASGCRQTVEPGRNGYLVPVRDVAALTSAMLRFVEEPALVERMGRESRRIAEQRFDVHHANAVILHAMGI